MTRIDTLWRPGASEIDIRIASKSWKIPQDVFLATTWTKANNSETEMPASVEFDICYVK